MFDVGGNVRWYGKVIDFMRLPLSMDVRTEATFATLPSNFILPLYVLKLP
jgi:hypothetical protein